MVRWGLFCKPGGSGLTSSAISSHSIMDVTLNLNKKKKEEEKENHTPLWILFQRFLGSVPVFSRFCSKAKKWVCPCVSAVFSLQYFISRFLLIGEKMQILFLLSIQSSVWTHSVENGRLKAQHRQLFWKRNYKYNLTLLQ